MFSSKPFVLLFFFFFLGRGEGASTFHSACNKKLYLVSICFEVVNETLQAREEIIPI